MLPNLDSERRLQALEKFTREIRGDRGATEPAAWTPAWTGTGTAGVFTYTNQFGRYTRIGNLAFIQARLTISAIPTPPVGNMTITGLPLTAVNVANVSGLIIFGFIHNFNYAAAAIELTGIVPLNSARIDLYESFDNIAAVQVPAANFTNVACDLIFGGVYQVSGT